MPESTTFLFVGNNLAVDFVNTKFMGPHGVQDFLAAPKDLSDWLDQAGVRYSEPVTIQKLEQFRAFRDGLKQMMDALIDEGSMPCEDEVALINSHLAHYKPSAHLALSSDGLSLEPLATSQTLDCVLGDIAHEAAHLFIDPKQSCLKKCASDQCVLLFSDTSKAKRRKWCSMEICGNRAKAANYYQEHKKVSRT